MTSVLGEKQEKLDKEGKEHTHTCVWYLHIQDKLDKEGKEHVRARAHTHAQYLHIPQTGKVVFKKKC